ncbi:putative alpha-mannosyltransferase, nucleotide-diphospho-sugar transferase [Plasmopara halstedii]
MMRDGLHPRSTTSNGAKTNNIKELSPYEEALPTDHAVPSSTGKRWWPHAFIIGGAIYVIAMGFWFSHYFNALEKDSDSVYLERIKRNRDDNTMKVSPYHGHLTQEQQKKTNLAKAEVTSTLIQAAIDNPMKASQVKEALRLAREAVVAKLEMDSIVSSRPLATQSETLNKAEFLAQDALLLPNGETNARNLTCLGWRATDGCSPYGPRKPEDDLACTTVIPFDQSGYCEVQDKESGERFRVMLHYCNSLKSNLSFRCVYAAKFASFRHEIRERANRALTPGFTLPNLQDSAMSTKQRDGIVMVIYPKMIPSAYATIKTLREVQGCQLPIELWYRSFEMDLDSDTMKSLTALAEKNELSRITFHEITNVHAAGFDSKVCAIYNSHFERILFLDADNVPSRNPTFLFSSTEFLETGAIFWPDFWHPQNSIFNVHSHSVLWELLDMPFINMFEQESGQILIDRRRHAQALDLVMFFTFHESNHFESMQLVHGDKDLFRLAWLKLDAPFHMIKSPPAIAGKIINGIFCGMTMVQHDAQGDVLFLHRNSRKLMGEPLRKTVDYKTRAIARSARLSKIRSNLRLEGKPIPSWNELFAMLSSEETPSPTLEAPEPDGYPDSVVWTHLLTFNNTSNLEDYIVQVYNASPEFDESQTCYGERDVSKSEHFYVQNIASLPFAGLETHIRRFAAEAVELNET